MICTPRQRKPSITGRAMAARFSSRMDLIKPSAIRELMKYGSDPRIISFGGGYPDPTTFPVHDLLDSFQQVLSGNAVTVLQYSESGGLPRLRAQIAHLAMRDGIDCTAEEVLVLQGAQQGLDLVAKMLLDAGDLVMTERPTFLGAISAFNPYQPAYDSVSIDADGIDVDDLEKKLRTRVPKLLYTVPDFQNPSGATLSLEKRRRLVELATSYGFTIVEDSPYRPIRFTGDHLPTLMSLDEGSNVIHIGSFSKILAPALRLGWAIAPAAMIDKLSLLKLAADTQCSTSNMAVVSHLLDHLDLEAHLAKLRADYGAKKQLMLGEMEKSFPASVTWSDPEGGLFTWLRFPADVDTADLLTNVSVPRANVAFVPGFSFFANDPVRNFARFSFATATPAAITQGIGALGKVLFEEKIGL